MVIKVCIEKNNFDQRWHGLSYIIKLHLAQTRNFKCHLGRYIEPMSRVVALHVSFQHASCMVV